MQPLLSDKIAEFSNKNKDNSLNSFDRRTSSGRFVNSSRLSDNRSNKSNLDNHAKRNQLLILSELIYRELCDEVITSDFESPSIPDVLYEVVKEMIES
jgi:hypothetical protein